MAQLQRTRRSCDNPWTPRAPTSPTFEQLLREEDELWSTRALTPTYGMSHDQEDNLSPTRGKKSVLTKVREKAKKLTYSLSGKKKYENGRQIDDGSPPPWGAAVDDYDEDDHDIGWEVDPEYLGDPMYESEAAPENLKETARQHPRADPVVSPKHQLNTLKIKAEENEDNPMTPNKTITETVTEKLAPAYAKVSDATHTIASKIAGLSVTSPKANESGQQPQILKNTSELPFSPRAGTTVKKSNDDSGIIKQSSVSHGRTHGPVKEGFVDQIELEEEDDERALSEAITEAISPRNNSGDTGVVEMVKDAVTSLLWNEEPVPMAPNSSSAVPIFSGNISTAHYANSRRSTNSQYPKISKPAPTVRSVPREQCASSREVVEEENHGGRILQAN